MVLASSLRTSNTRGGVISNEGRRSRSGGLLDVNSECEALLGAGLLVAPLLDLELLDTVNNLGLMLMSIGWDDIGPEII